MFLVVAPVDHKYEVMELACKVMLLPLQNVVLPDGVIVAVTVPHGVVVVSSGKVKVLSGVKVNLSICMYLLDGNMPNTFCTLSTCTYLILVVDW